MNTNIPYSVKFYRIVTAIYNLNTSNIWIPPKLLPAYSSSRILTIIYFLHNDYYFILYNIINDMSLFILLNEICKQITYRWFDTECYHQDSDYMQSKATTGLWVPTSHKALVPPWDLPKAILKKEEMTLNWRLDVFFLFWSQTGDQQWYLLTVSKQRHPSVSRRYQNIPG